ncbi:hypothetical protein ACFL20_12015 [Spirochaetota bacterium]
MKKPMGFAQYKMKGNLYRAISSDGVHLRVYRVENEPFGDSKMWKQSVDFYLKGKGYHRIKQTDVENGNGKKGDYSEYIYRFNGMNYIYSLTLYNDDKYIFVIETGGVESFFNNRRDSILKAIRAFKIIE